MSKKLTEKQLFSIARDVRKELKSFRKIKAKDPAIVNFNSMPSDMCGFCMFGSIMVFQALKKLNRDPVIVQGFGHWFTECDGFLIDVTASQFGRKDIIVKSIANGRPDEDFWEDHHRSKTIKGASTYGDYFSRYARQIKRARQLMKALKK